MAYRRQYLTPSAPPQVVTELHGKRVAYRTQYLNVRENAVWKKFPEECWKGGLTYQFVRIFITEWEKQG